MIANGKIQSQKPAGRQKDLSPLLENSLQKEAFHAVCELEDLVIRCGNPDIIETWRNLKTSDHFYYMRTRNGTDGEEHSCFSNYESPYAAYINYMNVLNDFRLKINNLRIHEHQKLLEFERRHEQPPIWAEREQTHYLDATTNR